MPVTLATTLALIILHACAQAPYTGRQQLMLVSDQEANQMGMQAAQEVRTTEPVITGTPQADKVQVIGRRIAAVEKDSGYDWRFHLIGKDIPNAFALPGGNVFVYQGLFKYARNDAQLAAVIAHEIAHVLARHGSERMSVAMASQMATGVAGQAAGSDAFAQAFGMAANYGVVMPYSRTQESEADRIGLILMAKAGYPPEAAVDLWRNMMTAPGAKPPEFLSTHPANETRIRDIQHWIPEARSYLPR